MSHAAAAPDVLRTSTGLPTGKVAMWWFLASEIAIFGGLIASYVLCRLAHPEWRTLAAGTNQWAGALNTLVLLSSSLSAVLAHHAAHHGDGRRAARLCGLTVLGGGVFLVVKAFEYGTKLHHGITPVSDLFWGFYFFMTGLHALHVVAGMTALAVIGLAASKGRALHRVEYAGMYWHLVDVIWIFLFPLLYLAA